MNNQDAAQEHEDEDVEDEATSDGRETWAKGQWKAWKEHEEKELSLNETRAVKKTKKTIVEEFAEICRKRGWNEVTANAIRGKRRRKNEADPTYRTGRLDDSDRIRARDLFGQLQNWDQATAEFNRVTGRNMTKGALIQASRRLAPPLPPELAPPVDQPPTNAARPWSASEVTALAKYENLSHRQIQDAYVDFLTTMTAKDSQYEKRSYQAFLNELNLYRRGLVEEGQKMEPGKEKWSRKKRRENKTTRRDPTTVIPEVVDETRRQGDKATARDECGRQYIKARAYGDKRAVKGRGTAVCRISQKFSGDLTDRAKRARNLRRVHRSAGHATVTDQPQAMLMETRTTAITRQLRQ